MPRLRSCCRTAALVSVGPYIVTQGNVLPLIVQSTQRLTHPETGIDDGDVFICNDPYLGAIHHPDFATVSPIFHEGELVAWIGASGHQLDTGGMDPGGFSIKAVDTHQEGLRMPPVKLVDARQGARGRARLDHEPGPRSARRAGRAGADRCAEHADGRTCSR